MNKHDNLTTRDIITTFHHMEVNGVTTSVGTWELEMVCHFRFTQIAKVPSFVAKTLAICVKRRFQTVGGRKFP